MLAAVAGCDRPTLPMITRTPAWRIIAPIADVCEPNGFPITVSVVIASPHKRAGMLR